MMEKKNKRGMFRRAMALSLAGTMMFGGAASVSAATIKDVFDAKYYSESNEDLQKAFGTNEKALYNHYRTFGRKEGRQMSELIDVEKYRNAYPDLDAAFGNDWNAYVNHYITFGFEEGRESFGTFDARAYADRYPDLKEAFGYDVLKLYRHYMQFGRSEGRNAAKVVYYPSVSAGNYSSAADFTGSVGNVENTAPITTMGLLTDPETGAPVANATIRFTLSSFTGLTEVVEETALLTEGTESTEGTEGAETTEGTESTETTEGTEGTESTEETENTEGTETTPGVYVVTTDENGYYEVPEFVPGVYTVEATAPGYLSLTLNSISINSDSGSFTLPTFQLLSSNMTGANTVAGTAVDATTNTGIANVTLNVRANWNNTSGDVLTTTVTDESGNYSMDLERGYYTIEFVLDGYTSTFVNVASSNAIGATNCVLNPNSTSTDVVNSTEFRVVLTWGETPRDLDSHLVGPSADGYFHVYFGDKLEYDVNGEVAVSLDVDDVTSYGPETITIKDADVNSTYYYSVYDFTNGGMETSTAMSASGANVKVYQGSVLVKEYNVPLNQTGYVWNVFKIENGTVVDINNYNSNYSSMYGQYTTNSMMRMSEASLRGDKN